MAEEEAATVAVRKRRRRPARMLGGRATTDLRCRSPGKEEEVQVAVRCWEAAVLNPERRER